MDRELLADCLVAVAKAAAATGIKLRTTPCLKVSHNLFLSCTCLVLCLGESSCSAAYIASGQWRQACLSSRYSATTKSLHDLAFRCAPLKPFVSYMASFKHTLQVCVCVCTVMQLHGQCPFHMGVVTGLVSNPLRLVTGLSIELASLGDLPC